MNISPLPVLPVCKFYIRNAPNLYPLYSLIRIMAGSIFFDFFRKVLKDVPSRVEPYTLVQLYSWYITGIDSTILEN